ncbi:Aga2p NDAI_0D03730 [Naumovozyma dairenensis CBS 421]|uniref:Uncharacterized protein n=1 Tax=Naumovozyma dairenensis (strain ATCC 10597 / BCRC 20456 / CBS 421 / NBRC 0211 / NRRL Y-12639) TaxID=1071378 RepID=G0WA76_NAUDC|nr:hypothetical protein NDAI_0D03730 [Naumovozyma dairenensis CBS 421]CCD24687.1 hypothetical protein NDAI_0D03730 [Naumovozyma dairenensis CBS 421]
MQLSILLPLISLIAPALAQTVSVSCETVPTGATVETTPYSSSTTNIVQNGVTKIGVFEYYKSVTYVSNCDPNTSSKGALIVTQTIF